MWNGRRNELFKGASPSSKRDLDREQNEALLYEQQNDSKLNDLSSKIAALKQVTIEIHADASSHSIIDTANTAFDQFKSSLSNTSTRLSRMTSVRHQRLTCYVAMAFVGLVLVFYIVSHSNLSSSSSPSTASADGNF